ncbi:ATP-binding protein [Natrialbaceae archaeon GCM10025810]|uniref:sensor histidine kinase n=1 Tax=Halovalidus salilacus TaxID=3075124 RepID=UPI003609E678
MLRWDRLVVVTGLLLIVVAAEQAVSTVGGPIDYLVTALDFALFSVPGLVMVYIGRWLPRSDVEPDRYRRVVAWGAGGVVVMFVFIVLRIIHPGVSAEFSFGTRAIALAMGSSVGLAIGVHDARAISRTREVERQNEELKRKHAVERHNEELRRTQERLEEVISELEASNERLEQFAYAVSHDLQEPLRMVSSYLQLLERRYAADLDEDAEEFIGFAVDGADRMRTMIDGLLEYSRVETQGDPFDVVDLEVAFEEVLDDLQFRIEETDAEITRESLPTVEGDGGQLRQVFQNLLSNAIEYAGEGAPRVHVSAERRPSAWRISVRDDGIGIDPADADRIFGIFQRLHSVDEHPGSGIGLSLCKRIVERHGGEIWVDSEPGAGSTFTFTLPLASESVSVTAPDRLTASSAQVRN